MAGKKGQTRHRTATTAYPCYLPILGEFSRSWSCRFAGCKSNKFLFPGEAGRNNLGRVFSKRVAKLNAVLSAGPRIWKKEPVMKQRFLDQSAFLKHACGCLIFAGDERPDFGNRLFHQLGEYCPACLGSITVVPVCRAEDISKLNNAFVVDNANTTRQHV